MEAFWVCQHCHSLNRSGTGRCYHCREAVGSKPKESSAVIRNAAAPTAFRPAGQAADAGPGPGRSSGNAVGAPIGPAPAAFVSGIGQRPAEATDYASRQVPASGPDHEFFSTRAHAEEQAARRRRTPLGWLGHRMDMWLVTRPVVGIRTLGYLTAVLLAILLLAIGLAVATLLPPLRTAILNVSVTAGWDQVSEANRTMAWGLALSLVILGSLWLLLFSTFLGLMAHNATGLGTESPLMGPGRAFRAWFRLLWIQPLLAVGMVGPAVLILMNYVLPGLILAFVTVELAQRRLDDPLGWMTDPARFLPDLHTKLGTSGSHGTVLGTLWRACFLVANSVAIVLYLVPISGIAVGTVANLSGHSDAVPWPADGTTPLQVAVLGGVGLLIVAGCASLALLIPLSIDLVNRQRTRQNLVRAGRSRPWASAGADLQAAAPRPEPSRSLPYATGPTRNVPAPEMGPARSLLSDEGDLAPLSNGFDLLDQASLYSPSTTSSSVPWEDPSLGSPPE